MILHHVCILSPSPKLMLLFHHLSPPSPILFTVKKIFDTTFENPYWVMHTLQKFMWRMNGSHEVFNRNIYVTQGWRMNKPGHPTLWSPHTSPCWPSSPSWPAPNHIILIKQEILSASQIRFCTSQFSPFSWWLSSTWVHCPWSKARPSCTEQKTWIWGAGSCEEWKPWLL